MVAMIPENNAPTTSEGITKVTSIDGFRRQDKHPQDSVEGEATISLDLAPKVEAGTYQLAFVGHRTALVYGKAAKVALQFQIIDQGPSYGLKLDRWYNCKRLIGKPTRGGNFQIGAHSDFLREYLNLFPDSVNRLDRISFRPFRTNVITGRVETVTHNAKQQKLPELMQYSIIRELTGAGA